MKTRDDRQIDRWETFFTTFNKTLSTMYASFLLKYSKSYLHTCIIFYMFIPFFFLQCHARGRVISLSRFGYTLIPPPNPSQRVSSKRFVTFAPFSPSFTLSISDFYLSLVLLGTDHRRWTQWGTPARSGSEKKKKRGKKRRRRKGGCLANLGNWHVRLRVYMYVRIWVCVCVLVCVCTCARVLICARVSVCV